MNLGPTTQSTIDEINETIRKEAFWYENNERFVIVEKFEVNNCKKGYDSDRKEVFRFVNNDGEMHRNNGNPSFISGHMIMWHKNGKSHRNNGKPATIRNINFMSNAPDIDAPIDALNRSWGLYHKGTPKEEYRVNGVLHRENDLPATVFPYVENHFHWFINGKLHRENNKPSIINGNFLYYHNNGVLYKSEIKYNNKLVNWIMKNPFKLPAIFFITIMILIFLL
jgi:hypothetical protein